MLAKKYRLKRKQINVIYKKGQSKNYGEIGAKVMKNQLACPRFAIVIPQAIVKKAVDRNRLRRVMFDEIQILLAQKEMPDNDYIIRLFKALTDEVILREKIRKIFQ